MLKIVISVFPVKTISVTMQETNTCWVTGSTKDGSNYDSINIMRYAFTAPCSPVVGSEYRGIN